MKSCREKNRNYSMEMLVFVHVTQGRLSNDGALCRCHILRKMAHWPCPIPPSLSLHRPFGGTCPIYMGGTIKTFSAGTMLPIFFSANLISPYSFQWEDFTEMFFVVIKCVVSLGNTFKCIAIKSKLCMISQFF